MSIGIETRETTLGIINDVGMVVGHGLHVEMGDGRFSETGREGSLVQAIPDNKGDGHDRNHSGKDDDGSLLHCDGGFCVLEGGLERSLLQVL